MKKLVLLAFAFATLGLNAQTNVYLKIDHMLANQPFSFNQGVTNNLGNDFSVTRLEYYISGIELVHDGGTVTPVSNLYVLANAGDDSTYQMLGSFNITTLEAVRFSVGVDSAKNHLDPALYPANDPLAPKSPSMHWGWAGGYRFVAIEGFGGAALTFPIEVHALLDENYFTQTISTAGISNGGNLIVSLTGNYEGTFSNIDVSSGATSHGGSGIALTLLENFSWNVFKSSEGNAAMNIEENNLPTISVSPNPVARFQPITIANLPVNASVSLTDITGRQYITSVNNSQIQTGNLSAGLYILGVSVDGELVSLQKIMIR